MFAFGHCNETPNVRLVIDRLAELSPGAEEKEKQVITLGVIRASDRVITQKVLRYNRLSEKYAVSIKKYDTPEDLNKAFLSGEIALIASGDRLLLRNRKLYEDTCRRERGRGSEHADGLLWG